MVGKSRLTAWAKLKILEKIGDHLMKEELKELRQLPSPQAPFERGLSRLFRVAMMSTRRDNYSNLKTYDYNL